MQSQTFSIPIYYTFEYKTKKDKTILVGMNWYRNTSFHPSNQVKKYFHEYIANVTKHLTPIEDTFHLSIAIYYKNPTCDGANIASLAEKFVLDALQSLDIIQQDNVKYHLGTSWHVAGQDKESPRCEITLEPTIKD